MVTEILAFLTALLAGLPQLLTMIEAKQAKRNHETSALIQRDRDVLDGPPTGGVSPGPTL